MWKIGLLMAGLALSIMMDSSSAASNPVYPKRSMSWNKERLKNILQVEVGLHKRDLFPLHAVFDFKPILLISRFSRLVIDRYTFRVLPIPAFSVHRFYQVSESHPLGENVVIVSSLTSTDTVAAFYDHESSLPVAALLCGVVALTTLLQCYQSIATRA